MVAYLNNCVHWCNNCKIPIIQTDTKYFKKCPLCGGYSKYLSKDLRPVFPEERLLLELITKVKPNTYSTCSVWCNASTYYINGEACKLSNNTFKNVDIESVRNSFYKDNNANIYKYFDEYMDKFTIANQGYFNCIKYLATKFIIDVSNTYPDMYKYISFSGGKDSTVVADLVRKALGNTSIPYIFCDTTLEYPYTLDYIKRLEENPNLLIKIARNNEHDFYNLCDDIGVPTRMKRWCCTIFKTGAISKLLKVLFDDKRLLYFNGLRNAESNMRRKYESISSSSEQKIQNQISVSPIIKWKDYDVWLYIMSEKIDFNYAYRLGFPRVGCFCCPNGSERNEILTKIFVPDMAEKWNACLMDSAIKSNVDNPEKYVSKGYWKSKFGGSGIKSYKDTSISNKVCTIEENAKLYMIDKPITQEFYTLFIPFGDVRSELGKKLLNEVLVFRNGTPIISIQARPNYTVKIKTMNVKNHEDLHRRINYQLMKFKLCRRCYKCEAVCPKKAISIENDKYTIDNQKCSHCLNCTNNKYIHEGCMMRKYLKVKDDNLDR